MDYTDGVSRSLAPTSLMLGNVVTGMSVLAPAGMLLQLSTEFGVSVRDAGLLITFGAIALCIGSPLTAWLTSRIERRILLALTLAILAITNLASAFAPDYMTLLIIRIVMLSVGALFTPQAAGTVGLIVPDGKRGSAIAYVFLGWSVAAAVGLPLITLLASRVGWREAYLCIGLVAAASTILLAWRLPRGLFGAPVDLKTWADLFQNRMIVLLLLVTVLQMSGQFVVFTFIGPILAQLTGASPEGVGLVFALYGVFGFVGIAIATRIVDGWGPFRTSLLSATMVLSGLVVWAVGAGSYTIMAIGMALWGLGFASTNSMQQVRLVGAAPALAGASVALNTSALYVGQAIGSAIGGALLAHGAFVAPGYVGSVFGVIAVLVVIATRPKPTTTVSD
ncbi:MAG: putative inner rane transport protein [Tardiphaga sp.]|nr:putative inner rane transport protein [Tardiphaga sp.]